MTNTPSQSDLSWAPSSLRIITAPGGFAFGEFAYLRVKVCGFVKEADDTHAAICEPVERDGKPAKSAGSRQVYFCPVGHLVKAKTVGEEMQ